MLLTNEREIILNDLYEYTLNWPKNSLNKTLARKTSVYLVTYNKLNKKKSRKSFNGIQQRVRELQAPFIQRGLPLWS